VALVAANLLPLLGVLFLGWSLGLVLLLYWAESAVLLVSNLLKMVRLGLGGVLSAIFFTFHAGIFMLVHLLFLFVLFNPLAGRPLAAVLRDLAVPLLGLAASHAVSFWHNTVRRGERPPAVAAIMGGFYARIFVMQFTIIFGGMLMLALGSPIWALALLVLLKTGVDLGGHLRERRRNAPAAGLAESATSLP
jgi:hypothetical protein